MERKWFFGVLSIVFLISTINQAFGQVSRSEDMSIRVLDFWWTHQSDFNPRNTQRLEGYANSGEPLYCWMELRGSYAVLAYFELNQEVPIRARWFRQVGFTIKPAFTDKPECNFQENLPRYQEEVNMNGSFIFYVRSSLPYAKPGRWVVQPVYLDNKRLPCEVKNCELSIEVISTKNK